MDESAITGESAPVIREAGGDRSAVTGGTKVLSDWIVVKITSNPGETFLDRMIALVEGAVRQKTPNEIALNILLAVLTLVFLLVVVTLEPFANYAGTTIPIPVLIALLVCLIPTTIGALISAIGIAGMDRLVQQNVLAMSGPRRRSGRRRGYAAARQDRHDHAGQPPGDGVPSGPGRQRRDARRCGAVGVAGRRDARGRSIVVLAKEKYGLRGRQLAAHEAVFVPFTAHTRMSGVDFNGRTIRKGAVDAIERLVQDAGHTLPAELRNQVDRISREGGTPLAVAENGRALGVIHLKDIVKGGIRDRFAHLRAMGIKTVMITGDNPLTAAAIAAEAGVDDFMAEATPEEKLS